MDGDEKIYSILCNLALIGRSYTSKNLDRRIFTGIYNVFNNFSLIFNIFESEIIFKNLKFTSKT